MDQGLKQMKLVLEASLVGIALGGASGRFSGSLQGRCGPGPVLESPVGSEPGSPLSVHVLLSLVQVSRSCCRLVRPLTCALSFRGRATLAVVQTDPGTR